MSSSTLGRKGPPVAAKRSVARPSQKLLKRSSLGVMSPKEQTAAIKKLPLNFEEFINEPLDNQIELAYKLYGKQQGGSATGFCKGIVMDIFDIFTAFSENYIKPQAKKTIDKAINKTDKLKEYSKKLINDLKKNATRENVTYVAIAVSALSTLYPLYATPAFTVANYTTYIVSLLISAVQNNALNMMTLGVTIYGLGKIYKYRKIFTSMSAMLSGAFSPFFTSVTILATTELEATNFYKEWSEYTIKGLKAERNAFLKTLTEKVESLKEKKEIVVEKVKPLTDFADALITAWNLNASESIKAFYEQTDVLYESLSKKIAFLIMLRNMGRAMRMANQDIVPDAGLLALPAPPRLLALPAPAAPAPAPAPAAPAPAPAVPGPAAPIEGMNVEESAAPPAGPASPIEGMNEEPAAAPGVGEPGAPPLVESMNVEKSAAASAPLPLPPASSDVESAVKNVVSKNEDLKKAVADLPPRTPSATNYISNLVEEKTQGTDLTKDKSDIELGLLIVAKQAINDSQLKDDDLTDVIDGLFDLSETEVPGKKFGQDEKAVEEIKADIEAKLASKGGKRHIKHKKLTNKKKSTKKNKKKTMKKTKKHKNGKKNNNKKRNTKRISYNKNNKTKKSTK